MKFTVTRYDAVPNGDGERGSVLKPKVDTIASDPSSDSFLSSITSDSVDGYGDPMARRGRMFAKRQKRRLVFKDGECNISLSRISKRKRRYLGDIFTTLLDMK